MTSKFLRKHKTFQSDFPCAKHVGRLKRVNHIKKLGVFNVDKVTIVIEEYWRAEWCPGISKGKKRQFDEDLKTKGFLHRFKFKNHEYQIFQSKGRNRNLQFNPRHFNTWAEFVSYVREIIDGRPYHLSRVDCSWLLSKRNFSVDFLWWCLWVKGGRINETREYKDPLHAGINKSRLEEFSIGVSNFVIRIYDCDAHNSDKNRLEELKVHNCINFEVQVKGAKLKEFGLKKLSDLKNFNFDLFERVEFIKPVDGIFRQTRYPQMDKIWCKSGATGLARKLYKLRRNNDYLEERTDELEIKDKTFKDALLELAHNDWDLFLKNGIPPMRYELRRSVYDMPQLF